MKRTPCSLLPFLLTAATKPFGVALAVLVGAGLLLTCGNPLGELAGE